MPRRFPAFPLLVAVVAGLFALTSALPAQPPVQPQPQPNGPQQPNPNNIRNAEKKNLEEYKELTDKIQKVLGEKVKEVRVTYRLTASPACLVSDQYGMSMNLERLLKAAGQNVPATKPILEINPAHPIVQGLKYEASETRFADWSHILFDQALLAEGGQLEDPSSFVKRLNELMLALASKG